MNRPRISPLRPSYAKRPRHWLHAQCSHARIGTKRARSYSRYRRFGRPSAMLLRRRTIASTSVSVLHAITSSSINESSTLVSRTKWSTTSLLSWSYAPRLRHYLHQRIGSTLLMSLSHFRHAGSRSALYHVATLMLFGSVSVLHATSSLSARPSTSHL